jgi:hypothetical protein
METNTDIESGYIYGLNLARYGVINRRKSK